MNVDETLDELFATVDFVDEIPDWRHVPELGEEHDEDDDLRVAGGPGSGNFGHAGRPGSIGGSSSDGGGAPDGDAWIGRPTSAYPPSRPDGLDTKEQFSDGKGNYTPERTKLHDEIIAKHFKGATPVANPTATILGGGPGTGKSTIVRAHNIGTENTVVVNPDEIRNDLPEYALQADGKRPPSAAFSHEESSDLSKKIIAQAGREGYNVLLDGTGDSSIEKLGGKIAAMRARGAVVQGVYVTTATATAQARADARGERIGRMVPPSYLSSVHAAVSQTFPEAVRQGLFDTARLYDNEGTSPVLVAEARGKNLTILDQGLWDAFIAKGKS